MQTREGKFFWCIDDIVRGWKSDVRKPSRWCILRNKIPQPAHAFPVLLHLSAAVCWGAGDKGGMQAVLMLSIFFPLSGCSSVVLTQVLFVTKVVNQLCNQSIILLAWHESFHLMTIICCKGRTLLSHCMINTLSLLKVIHISCSCG